MGKNRLDYIDVLKGIGILLVIFSHSGAENDSSMLFVGGVFIPLFFVASGYTYKYRDESFLSFFSKKAKRLLKPYFFFSAILLLLYKRYALMDVLGVFYSRFCIYPYDSEENIFLMGGGNPPLWFLTSMLTAFIPFWLLMKYPSKAIWLLLLFFAYTFAFQYLPLLLPWSIDTACLMAIFMYFGYVLRNSIKLLERPFYLYLLLLLVYVILCVVNGGLNVSVREYGLSVLLYILTGCIGTTFLLWLSKRIEKTFMCKYLVALGHHSLVIFCIQMFLLRICHQVHGLLCLPTEGLMFYLVSFGKVLLVAIVGLYISKAMNKYMPWLFK